MKTTRCLLLFGATVSLTFMADLVFPGSVEKSDRGLLTVSFRESDFTRPGEIESASQLNLDTGTQHQRYSQFWLGQIHVPTATKITIEAEADDGMTLTIDGGEVIRGWHGSDRQGEIIAKEGSVLPVEVRFFQNGGTAFLRLFWSWAGHDRELIPVSAFTYTAGDLERIQAIADGREKLTLPEFQPNSPKSPASARPEWSKGPWLFLDQRTILSVDHLERVPGQPVRHGEPLVDGQTDGNFQPYVSVVKEQTSRRWRMWYNVPRTPGNYDESSLALIESADGIHWQRPHRVLTTPRFQFGASIIDEGENFHEKSKRYKSGWHAHDYLHVATSPDGILWTELAPGPLLRHSHDINAIDWDPVRGHYMAFVSFATKLDPTWSKPRRIPYMSTSEDLVNWRKPWPIIAPKPDSHREQGETEFYCMAGVIARGDVLIGLVKVLRDDLNAEAGLTATDLGDSRPYAGIGYTVLAWSVDGENWYRETEPFLDRNPLAGTWDRAIAWGDEQVIQDDEVFVYYGGYRQGHKSSRSTSRQIGLARLKVDRYLGFHTSGRQVGFLRTPVRTWMGNSLTVNADIRGELRAALCDPSGQFLPGFSFEECEPVIGNEIAHKINWRSSIPASLQHQEVQIALQVKEGAVFAFTVQTSVP